MTYAPSKETHPLSSAVSIVNNRVYDVVQIADSTGAILDSVGGEGGGGGGALPAVTPTTTSVPSSATSVTIAAANASRKGLWVANDSTAILRLSFSTPATSANAFVVIPAGGFFSLESTVDGKVPTGVIYGIWASANGTGQITELA